MSNLEIINAQGVGYTTEDFIPFRPSNCDKSGSISFKVKANGHFKRKMQLSVRGSDSGWFYTVRMQGGTINGSAEFHKNYPVKPISNETDRLDFAFVDKIDVEVEFTNEATVTLEQEVPTAVFNNQKNAGWSLTPVTCEACGPRHQGTTLQIHSWMNLFDKGFQINAVTCGASTGL